MQKIQTRELVADEPAAIDDWQATEVSFTTVRPLATTTLAEPGRSVTLAGGVKIEGHRRLEGQRPAGHGPSLHARPGQHQAAPTALRRPERRASRLTFTASRGNDPGLSVLELTNVADPSVVTPEAPLRLTMPMSLGPNEHVLPVAYDGEFFLPLGRVESRSQTPR